METDSQRSKFYRAWDEYKKTDYDRAVGLPLPAKPDVIDFVDKIVRSPWWKKRRPDIENIEVQFRQGDRIYEVVASEGWADLLVPMPMGYVTDNGKKYAMSEGDVLIHLCQALTPEEAAWHGPAFCRELNAAIKRWCGDNESRKLKQLWVKHKVKSRVVSDETKAIQRENWHKRQTTPENIQSTATKLEEMLAELEG